MKKTVAALLLASSVIAAPASAQYVVNTGTPPSLGSGYTLGSTQSLAGYFSLTAPTVVGSVEGYIGGVGGASGTISLYGDGDLPGTGSPLFSAGFTTAAQGGWQGVFGQSWSLGAGSYWVTFASTDQYMPSAAPNALSRYAFFNTGNGRWIRSDDLALGVRVAAGSVTAGVPEPASWALMIVGFGLVGGALRRRSVGAIRVAG